MHNVTYIREAFESMELGSRLYPTFQAAWQRIEKTTPLSIETAIIAAGPELPMDVVKSMAAMIDKTGYCAGQLVMHRALKSQRPETAKAVRLIIACINMERVLSQGGNMQEVAAEWTDCLRELNGEPIEAKAMKAGALATAALAVVKSQADLSVSSESGVNQLRAEVAINNLRALLPESPERALLREIAAWMVCYPITTPEDLCQNIPALYADVEKVLGTVQ